MKTKNGFIGNINWKVLALTVCCGLSLTGCGHVDAPSASFIEAMEDSKDISSFDESLDQMNTYYDDKQQPRSRGIVEGAEILERELEISETLHKYKLASWMSDEEKAAVSNSIADGNVRMTSEDLDEIDSYICILPSDKRDFDKLVKSGDFSPSFVYKLYAAESSVNADIQLNGYSRFVNVALTAFKLEVSSFFESGEVTADNVILNAKSETGEPYTITVINSDGIKSDLSLKSGCNLFSLATAIYDAQYSILDLSDKVPTGTYNSTRNTFLSDAIYDVGGLVQSNGNDGYDYTVAREKGGSLKLFYTASNEE